MANLIFALKVQPSNKFGKACHLLLGIQLMALRIPAENFLLRNSFNTLFQMTSTWDIFNSFAKYLLISAKYIIVNTDNTPVIGPGLHFPSVLLPQLPTTKSCQTLFKYTVNIMA